MTDDAVSDSKRKNRRGSYDPRLRRQSLRTGRETGCWVYIASDELEAAGVDVSGPPPFYRVWGAAGGGVFLRLYKRR